MAPVSVPTLIIALPLALRFAVSVGVVSLARVALPAIVIVPVPSSAVVVMPLLPFILSVPLAGIVAVPVSATIGVAASPASIVRASSVGLLVITISLLPTSDLYSKLYPVRCLNTPAPDPKFKPSVLSSIRKSRSSKL